MSRERPRRGVLPTPQESIEKMEKLVNAGRSYEAQQMYKSFSARYVTAQRYSEALEILEAGALIQLSHGQITCGAELANLFVETLVKGKFPFDEETFDRLKRMYEAFPKIPMPQNLDDEDNDMQKLSEALAAAKIRVECCSSFLKAALKWSMEFEGLRYGCPEFHDMLAEYIYSESPELDMAKVSAHFVRGSNPENFAAILVNFMGKCYPGEDDMAIARAVLMYLSQGNLRDANYIVDDIQKQLQSKNLDLPESDMIQFIVYLLQTLERDAYPLYRILRQKFKSSIDREPLFDELLDEIAEKFYGVQRRNNLQGMFGDFFKMMGGDMPA